MRVVTRRAFIGLGATGALVGIVGCDGSVEGGKTVTVTATPTSAAPPPPTATLLGLVFTTRLHVQHLTEAAATDERDAAILTQLLADRTAHLEALEAEYTRVSGDSAPAPSSSAAPDTTTQQQSSDPDEILGRIRGEAATAQTMFTDALAEASRFQAQLYASIAACVATHRMVLA